MYFSLIAYQKAKSKLFFFTFATREQKRIVLMALPNFLCVGAQKAGTTTLYEILKQHPEIYLPEKVKETKFFVYEEKYARGLSFYENQFFSGWNGQKAIGEVDPAIMFEEKAAQRIYESLGKEVKLIFILRNPAERAYSHFLMSQRKGFEDLPFEKAIEAETERLEKKTAQKFNYSYISRGFYSQQVLRFKNFFTDDQMLFLLFEEDLIKNRKETFNRLQDFLSVKRAELNLDIRSNEAALPKIKAVHQLTRKKNPLRNIIGSLLPPEWKRSMQKFISRKNAVAVVNSKLDKKREQELLDNYFITDIQQLEKIIHRDLSTWYSNVLSTS
ncbi:MAG: sulfotransferase domain-containing protein [Chitinophagales bacterium]|nr:sulfotransferase domain-containing protein [Chitinophagales bacterium]